MMEQRVGYGGVKGGLGGRIVPFLRLWQEGRIPLLLLALQENLLL